MKTLSTIIAAATLFANTAAFAGYTGCRGTVVVGPEWTTIEDEATIPLPKDHPRYTPNPICRFKTASPLGKRILRKCPDGSGCEVSLSIDNSPRDHRKSGGRYGDDILTIVRWPENGVERDAAYDRVNP